MPSCHGQCHSSLDTLLRTFVCANRNHWPWGTGVGPKAGNIQTWSTTMRHQGFGVTATVSSDGMSRQFLYLLLNVHVVLFWEAAGCNIQDVPQERQTFSRILLLKRFSSMWLIRSCYGVTEFWVTVTNIYFTAVVRYTINVRSDKPLWLNPPVVSASL
jgi:hypothetical protein